MGSIIPVSSEQDIGERIAVVRKGHHDASHICYAFRLHDPMTGRVQEGKSDAGEPSGTAGQPILFCLRHHDVVNALLTVVRHFGGSKLGRGGLARAYGDCASLVINQAQFSDFVPRVLLRLQVPPEMLGIVQNIVHQLDGEVVHVGFGIEGQVDVYVPAGRVHQFRQHIASSSSGRIGVFSAESH